MSDNQWLHILKDKRVNCYSIITSMTVKDYLRFVQDAYDKKGGIDKQRESLRKTTAIRIRKKKSGKFGQSINDLKSWFRASKYVQRTLKLLGQNPDPIFIENLTQQVSQMGRKNFLAPIP